MDDLLSRMTLEEKVGQMNMPCVYEGRLGESQAAKTEACRRFAAGTHEPGLGPGGGFFTLPNTILHEGPRQQALFLNELQEIARKTRLGIPLLQTEEGTHGLMCSGGTVFPEGLALGSTWDLGLFEAVYAATAREARAIGVHQVFTLVVEPNRDPRLGRNQEGYSEDPWLVSRIAETIVRAVQGGDVSRPDKAVAGLCHYPGQSQPASGLERGAMEISERMLRETFLPPWVAGIRGAGALGVMATYPAIDGVPVHASEKILTRILRDELGFEGLVLSEGGGLSTLLYEGLAPSQKEAGALALRAGVDVGISYEDAYMGALVESVRSGVVPEALVDRAVRRILRQKLRLGLFERPLVDPERAAAVVHAPEHRELALRAAREGIVLLKNERDLLPLRKDLREIAVIGPNADDPRNQLGDYTAQVVLQDVVTVLEGVRAKVGAADARAVREGMRRDRERDRRDRGRRGRGEEGAGRDRRPRRERVARAGEDRHERRGLRRGEPRPDRPAGGAAEGRPRHGHADRPRAGERPAALDPLGGRARARDPRGLAARASGAARRWPTCSSATTSPRAGCPITVPRHVGQLPVAYDHKPSKAYWIRDGWGKPYADMSPEPLFEFGHGLSYTRFAYANLRIAPPRIGHDGSVEVSVDVSNEGKRPGKEVVQLYLRDPVASVVVPVQRLRGFEKVSLAAGETRTVRFTLRPPDLALLDADLRWTVEPGTFEVAVGSSSRKLPLTGRFEVIP